MRRQNEGRSRPKWVVLAAATFLAVAVSAQQLPTGGLITPAGFHRSVGSYPVNMVLTKDKKYAVVTTIGFRQFLSTVNVTTGEVADQVSFNREDDDHTGLYYGVTVAPDGTVYVSNGAKDTVSRFKVGTDGKLTTSGAPFKLEAPKERGLPLHAAGLATNSDGSWLFVVNNQTNEQSDFRGSLSVVDTKTGKELSRVPTAGFPLAAAAVTKGVYKDRKVFVGSERDGLVESFESSRGTVPNQIHTGANVTGLLLSKDEKTLFVSNAGSDTVSLIDTTSDMVKATVLLRPAVLRGLPSAAPTGMTLAPDGKTLYVALQDMNAVAVVSLPKATLRGYIPTGWLPTSVVATEKGLLVASAKGVKQQNPNDKPVALPGLKRPDRYIENIIDGTVSWLKVPTRKQLRKMTQQVIENNGVKAGLTTSKLKEFKNPGIKHVIYVIKENRTYDNVFGDLERGNGDPSQCMFPRNVTPNQHAIVDRFALFDNFHVCAEVSQDGWMWSTTGMISPYASRNTPYNYSGRGRNYDTEGTNNAFPVDLVDIPDVAKPAGGYIWDQCAKNGVSYRNYGCFVQGDGPEQKRYGKDLFGDNRPSQKALLDHTDPDFRQYDNNYPDSEIYQEYDFSWGSMRKSFGAAGSKSRFQQWQRDFSRFVEQGDLPQFMIMRLPNDHTQGTRVGSPTPQSCVADNDYAVGQVVQAVSNSPYWKETAIFILEDDAQNGYDHVDAHRSTAYVISPFVKRSLLDSRFYNTDSMLRTMELLLGLPPMNKYDAVATPMDVFADRPVNLEPYTAIKPDRDVVCATNDRRAYRAADSEGLNVLFEESGPDEDLNDILWGAVMGPRSPRPPVINPWRYSIGK